jgi:hypothetical protein
MLTGMNPMTLLYAADAFFRAILVLFAVGLVVRLMPLILFVAGRIVR